MLFNSYSFIFIFLPTVLVFYWLVVPTQKRKHILVLSSYIFYGVWSAKFAVLMLLTTSVDFFTAKRIAGSENPSTRKAWLVISLAANLGVLGVFKYYDFFAGSLNAILPEPMLPLLRVALPIGISFYTFESMSYTIDVYNGKGKALNRFIDYAHFVTMFPRLVAGPIVRYSQMADQFAAVPRRLVPDHIVDAIHFFTLGLIKKILIADVLAFHLVNDLFADPGSLQVTSAWAAALGYSVQLYMDFSGYSDMAVGLGRLLGFELPRNFNLPYRAVDIADFWRRWHISLSTWLREYLYIPLGGNRLGSRRRAINLFVTMVLGGLWHGANWTFVAWGALHGFALLLHHAVGKWRPVRMPRPLATGMTFLIVVLGWVLFRADSIADGWRMYSAMFGANGLGLGWLAGNAVSLTVLAMGLVLSFTVDTYDLRPRRQPAWALVYAGAFTVCLLRFAIPSPFLYFQF